MTITAQPILEDWMTYAEVAKVLMLSVKTLQNLASLHKLERRYKYIGPRYRRRRIARLAPQSVRRLAELTNNSYLIAR